MVRRAKEDVLPKEKLKVTSRVIDQFFKPQVNYGTSQQLKELAKSMSGIVPSLDRLEMANFEQEKEEQTQKGIEAQKNFKGSFKEFSDAGLIPEGANPYFVLAFNEMEVKDKARQFNSFINQEYALNQGNFTDNPNPDAFNEFFDEKLSQWSMDNNLTNYDAKTVLDHFEPSIAGSRNQLNQTIVQKRISNYTEKFDQLLGVEFGETLKQKDFIDIPADFVGDEDEYKNTILASQLVNSIDSYKDVKNITKINDNLISTVIGEASANLDTDLLDIAKHIKTAGGTLYDIPKYKKLLENARDTILRDLEQEENEARTRKRDERTDGIQKGKDDYIAWFNNFETEDGVKRKPSQTEVDAYLMSTENQYNEVDTFARTYKNQYGAIVNPKAVEEWNRELIDNPYGTNLENSLEALLIDKDIDSQTYFNLKDKMKTFRNGVDAEFLDSDVFSNRLESGDRVITQNFSLTKVGPALAQSEFRATFKARAYVISAYVKETFGNLPKFEQSQKFDDLIEAEYQRQLTIFTQTSESLASTDDPATGKLDRASKVAEYPVLYKEDGDAEGFGFDTSQANMTVVKDKETYTQLLQDKAKLESELTDDNRKEIQSQISNINTQLLALEINVDEIPTIKREQK